MSGRMQAKVSMSPHINNYAPEADPQRGVVQRVVVCRDAQPLTGHADAVKVDVDIEALINQVLDHLLQAPSMHITKEQKQLHDVQRKKTLQQHMHGTAAPRTQM